MTAERLADLLHGVGLDPTGHDLLDVLWLASKITPDKVSHQREPGEAAEAELGNKPRPSGEAERQESDQRGGMPGRSGDSPAPRADVDPIGALHPRDLSGRMVPREGQASIVRVPAVSILTDQLYLARAMRPLKRKVASRHSTAIDEEATATRIAEEQIWIPAMRPIPARWLELAVVVDGYESMTIWHQMVNELRGILEGLGAFRDVRFWILDGDASEPDRLNVRAWGSDSPLRSARELIDPTGRRAILTFSDFLGPLWRSGAAQRLLRLWGRSQPVAVLQPMPQRLWSYTSVRVTPVQLHAHRSGVPNSQLAFRDLSRPLCAQAAHISPASIPVPVLELDADWLASWSRLLNGSAPSGVSALAVLPDETQSPAGDRFGPRSPTASQRVERFRASASPEAFRLAVYLTAAPINLPVIRLIQHVMFALPKRAQLAEVIFGGLLRRTSKGTPADPDDIEYDFHTGVRDLLQQHLHRKDAIHVLLAVSDFVDVRFGQARDFRALLAGEGVTGDYLIGDESKPFALVARRVLQLLSGHYAITADRIAVAIDDIPDATSASTGTIAPEQPAAPVPEQPMALDHIGSWRRPTDDTVADPTLRTLSLQARRSRAKPLVCPYCYHVFRDRDILFRCSGSEGALGERCPGERDEVLADKMGQSDNLPPIVQADGRRDEAVCPRCHESTRIQVCPDCHSRLPATFHDVQGRLIALAGASEAGKTAFMTVLIHELRHQAGDLLNSTTFGADDTTQERYVNRYERPLYKDAQLPRTTTQSGHIQPLVFRFTMDQRGRLRRRRKELLLSFMDGAGEDLVSPLKTELMARYLTVADSVLVLIDPLQLPRVRALLRHRTPLPPALPPEQQPVAAFNRITQLLLAGVAHDTIDKPVALVLTKIDALRDLLPADSLLRTPAAVHPYFDSRESSAIQTEIIDLLAQWDASAIERLVRNHFTRSHFFAVSALGASPVFPHRSPSQGITPHRVTDPFLWLLNEFSFLSSR